MVKTFQKIWLASKPELPSAAMSLICSTNTLLSVHDPDPNDIFKHISQKIIDMDIETEEKRPKKAEAAESETSLYRPLPSTIFRKSRIFKNVSLYLIRSCIEQLEGITLIHRTKVDPRPVKPFLHQTLSDRYGTMHIDYDLIVIGGTYTNFHKTEKNVQQIIKILEELHEEIYMFSASTCLDIFAEMHSNIVEEEKQLEMEVLRKEDIYKNLLDTLYLYRDEMGKMFQDVEDKVSDITAVWKNLTNYTNAVAKYTKGWEHSRRQQNFIKLKLQEKNEETVIEDMKQKAFREDVCYENVALYYSETNNNHLHAIEELMNTYDKEFEEREMKIYKMQHDVDRTVAAKERLQSIYESRSKEIEDWLEYKKIKKEKEERLLLENQTATKIQAWWRGVMVRRQLGPYSKRKKQKRGDKKNKKKKTKK